MVDLDRSINIEAAVIASQTGEFEAVGLRVEAIVRRVASQHRDSGEYAASIKHNRSGNRVKDFVVYTDDPDAWYKEFGTTTRKGTFQPGVQAFATALGEAGRG